MSVGYDDVLALVKFEFREFFRRRNDALRQHDVASVIVSYYARVDVCAAAVGACVVVRDESYCRYVLLRVGFQCGVDVAFVVHLHVAEALVFEFFFQIFSKYKLF